MTAPLADVVVLSTADFDAPVWTNKQHLATRLADHTRVIYVNSLGLRAPSIRPADVKRIVRRLIAGRRPARVTKEGSGAHDGIEVLSPLVLPWHALGPVRLLNRFLIWLQVRRRVAKLERPLLWTFSPLTYGLERECRATVYHSVDILHAQPRMPRRAIIAGERRLLRTAQRIVASSSGVRAHLERLGAHDVLLWENVADTEMFARSSARRRPSAIFAGNITPAKVDSQLLLALAQAGVSLELAGPWGIDGTGLDPTARELLLHPNVTNRGLLAPSDLAELFAQCRVGLVPYKLNEYTSGVFPLKVYEYMSAGLVVLSTPLPSLMRDDLQGVLLRAAEDGFVDACVSALESFSEDEAAERTRLAAAHSWSARVRDAVSLLQELS